jgi:hypothetical protein
MKLQYVGRHSPIVIPRVVCENGSIGLTIKTGDIYDYPADVAADLMHKFKGSFIEPIEKRGRKKIEPERTKMLEKAEKNQMIEDLDIKEL